MINVSSGGGGGMRTTVCFPLLTNAAAGLFLVR